MNDQTVHFSRRKFVKIAGLSALPLITGCVRIPRSIENAPTHHTAYGYRNVPPMAKQTSPGFSFMWRRVKGSFIRPDIPPGHNIAEEVALRNYVDLREQQTLTWLGHSAFLLKLQGRTILLDPWLTDTASPLAVGPKRFVPPGISIQNLPPIDVLVISHSHYDHLDVSTLKNLANKDKIQVLVPLGLKGFLQDLGYQHTQELDWQQSVSVSGLNFTALPAIHFSNRGLNDYNETLWCSWAVESNLQTVFYAGDTAYSETLFNYIRQKIGPVNTAIVPIGAYEPAGLMVPVHTTPEQGLQVGIDLGARNIVACHWGTIELSDEPHFEPPVRFLAHAQKQDLAEDAAWVMKIGETRPIDG